VGKKSYDHFFKRHFDIYAKHTGVFDKLEFNTAIKIVNEVIKGYKEKKFDRVLIVYNEFKSVIQSKIIEEQFLPVKSLTPSEELPGYTNRFVTNYIFEPAIKDIIDYLLPRHLNTQIWRVLLESYASEQAARMTAMDSATNNANDLITSLQLYYNKARQASITKELLEIVAGADALKETS
jgi:F-type H+-transporting ATPase subunit gamma